MIILQHRTRGGVFIAYDHHGENFKFCSNEKSLYDISGYFDYCEGSFLAFYCYENESYFVCNSTRVAFDSSVNLTLSDEVGPHWTTLVEEQKKRFVVYLNGIEKINILYPRAEINSELDDWVQPVSDIELFDFCYWVYNFWKEKRAW